MEYEKLQCLHNHIYRAMIYSRLPLANAVHRFSMKKSVLAFRKLRFSRFSKQNVFGTLW